MPPHELMLINTLPPSNRTHHPPTQPSPPLTGPTYASDDTDTHTRASLAGLGLFFTSTSDAILIVVFRERIVSFTVSRQGCSGLALAGVFWLGLSRAPGKKLDSECPPLHAWHMSRQYYQEGRAGEEAAVWFLSPTGSPLSLASVPKVRQAKAFPVLSRLWGDKW